MLSDPASHGIRLVVVQATSFCNIDCKYCYLANRSVHKAITFESLIEIRKWLGGLPNVN